MKMAPAAGFGVAYSRHEILEESKLAFGASFKRGFAFAKTSVIPQIRLTRAGSASTLRGAVAGFGADGTHAAADTGAVFFIRAA